MGLFDGTSLEQPVTCARCRQAMAACECPRDAHGEVCAPSDQSPRVRREKRRGKWCTVIADLDPAATDMKAMLKALRTELGTGGGESNGELVLQGDHRDAVVDRLIALGYKAKASGG